LIFPIFSRCFSAHFVGFSSELWSMGGGVWFARMNFG
jgi:hypothetical protein